MFLTTFKNIASAAKPLSAASQLESREWAWLNDSQSDSTALKIALKSALSSDANRRALLLAVNFISVNNPEAKEKELVKNLDKNFPNVDSMIKSVFTQFLAEKNSQVGLALNCVHEKST